MSGGVCEEGGGHVLLVPRGAAQAAVPTLLARTVPARITWHLEHLPAVLTVSNLTNHQQELK